MRVLAPRPWLLVAAVVLPAHAQDATTEAVRGLVSADPSIRTQAAEELGYAHLFAGEFIKQAPNANNGDDTDYVYSQVSLVF